MQGDRLSRTLTLHSTYQHLDALQILSALGHKVLYEHRLALGSDRNAEFWKTLRVAFDDLTRDNIKDVRAHISDFLISTNSLYYCGWVANKDNSNENGPNASQLRFPYSCDKELLFEMSMADVSWTYHGVSPGLYCDEIIAQHFFAGRNGSHQGSPLYNLETMLMQYQEWYFRNEDRDVSVFRTYENRGDNKGYVVRPKTQELCDRRPL